MPEKEYIEREAAVNTLNKALFSYEDETEAKFKDDPELDLAEWFFHRIFVQVMNGRDRQAILDLPAADVRPVVLCRDCKHWDIDWVPNYAKEKEHFCPVVTLTTRDDWFCANGEKREES